MEVCPLLIKQYNPMYIVHIEDAGVLLVKYLKKKFSLEM